MLQDQKTSMARVGGIARMACVAGLCTVLAAGSSLAVMPTAAYAVSSQTASELAALTQQVDSAAATYQEATAKVEELNQQISEMADEILDYEQNKLPEQQQKASDAACNLYKLKTSSTNLLSMLLNSSSFGELITQSKYLSTIQEENTAALERLNEMYDELEAKMDEVSKAKDDAEAQQQKASEALASAQAAQAKIAERAQSEDAAEAAAARQAAEAAAAKTASMQQGSAGTASSGDAASSSDASSSGSSSSSSTNSGSSSSSSSSSSGSSSSSNSSSSNSGSSSSTSGWKSGVASYYGIGDGFMGGTTANGSIVTETSMAIAMLNVPFGTRVEISYHGKSVIAVVNDRGPYAAGRVIDMQPAVARALGFLSVGVDTVQYRFL